ncbi:Zinc finger C2H2 type family protein [Brugia pahangi]
MFFTASMTSIIWFNLLLCIASGKNETFSPTNLEIGDEGSGISGISDSFNILDYTNFEPEFPSDSSQLIDFVLLSEIEETDLLRNAPYPGFSNSYDFIGHTNLEASLDTDMDSYRNVQEDVNGKLKTNNNEVRYPPITDTQSETFLSLNLDTDDIYHIYTLTWGNTDEGSETDKKNYTCHYRGCTVLAKNYKEYLTHKKTHGQTFIYECKVSGCGRTFDYKSTFYNHKQTHKSHPQCECCGKFFTSKDGLTKHKKCCQKKSHGRSYECFYPGCALSTKTYNEYIAHKKTHGEPFIYECKVPGCGRTFNHKASFSYHKQTHKSHPQCKYCSKIFTNRNGLRVHMRRKTKSR